MASDDVLSFVCQALTSGAALRRLLRRQYDPASKTHQGDADAHVQHAVPPPQAEAIPRPHLRFLLAGPRTATQRYLLIVHLYTTATAATLLVVAAVQALTPRPRTVRACTPLPSPPPCLPPGP